MKKASKSGLFLMELIIAILFFSVASAICVQLFTSAYVKSHQSTALSLATLKTQAVAEAFRSAEGDIVKFSRMINAKKGSDGVYVCYFDEHGNFDSKSFCNYEIRIIEDTSAEIPTIDIHAYQKNDAENSPIFSLRVAHYNQAEKSEVLEYE